MARERRYLGFFEAPLLLSTRDFVLYEKYGFVREGLLRRDVYVDGAYENSVMMAVLFSEE